jgi:putative endonuclease
VKSTVEHGREAENAVADYLRAQGAAIIGMNVRSGHYEIDLIATQNDLVMIVEVRTRGAGSFANAFESIDWKKRKRIIAAAQSLWRSRLSKLPGVNRLRFDAASVTFEEDGEARVEYVSGAFTA